MTTNLNIEAVSHIYDSLQDLVEDAELRGTAPEILYAIAEVADTTEEHDEIWAESVGAEAIVTRAWELVTSEDVSALVWDGRIFCNPRA